MKNITSDKINYAESLSRLMNDTYIKHITPIGFVWIERFSAFDYRTLSKKYSSLEEAKKAIDESYQNLKNSIR